MRKVKSNQQIFKALIDQNNLFAAVLKEALNDYAEKVKNWEPTENENRRMFIAPNYWKQTVKECKEELDKLYKERRP